MIKSTKGLLSSKFQCNFEIVINLDEMKLKEIRLYGVPLTSEQQKEFLKDYENYKKVNELILRYQKENEYLLIKHMKFIINKY